MSSLESRALKMHMWTCYLNMVIYMVPVLRQGHRQQRRCWSWRMAVNIRRATGSACIIQCTSMQRWLMNYSTGICSKEAGMNFYVFCVYLRGQCGWSLKKMWELCLFSCLSFSLDHVLGLPRLILQEWRGRRPRPGRSGSSCGCLFLCVCAHAWNWDYE